MNTTYMMDYQKPNAKFYIYHSDYRFKRASDANAEPNIKLNDEEIMKRFNDNWEEAEDRANARLQQEQERQQRKQKLHRQQQQQQQHLQVGKGGTANSAESATAATKSLVSDKFKLKELPYTAEWTALSTMGRLLHRMLIPASEARVE